MTRDGYALANGIRMFYVEEGEGPLVLLCHGFPESWYSWRHQLAPIGEAGFRAVAVDLPGYGRSDKPDATYDVVWLTDCLAGLIEALGHETAVVVGHDWGGLLAWPFARLHPERTAGVIGLNVPDLPRPPVPTTEWLAERGGDQHSYMLFFQKRYEAEAVIEANIDQFVTGIFLGPVTVQKEAFTKDDLKVYADTFRPRGSITPPLEYYRNMDRNWELMAPHDDTKIEVPCLMICAEGDTVLPPRLAEGMDSRVPDLEVVTVADCGHWTQQEQPQVTTHHVLA
ncbi:MAG TPA: alpha/beta hydrolase, partial [Actinomycetota bacterium]|nr:alpha/beta hydrolase [Actinomycetota bacterium]